MGKTERFASRGSSQPGRGRAPHHHSGWENVGADLKHNQVQEADSGTYVCTATAGQFVVEKRKELVVGGGSYGGGGDYGGGLGEASA